MLWEEGTFEPHTILGVTMKARQAKTTDAAAEKEVLVWVRRNAEPGTGPRPTPAPS